MLIGWKLDHVNRPLDEMLTFTYQIYSQGKMVNSHGKCCQLTVHRKKSKSTITQSRLPSQHQEASSYRVNV